VPDRAARPARGDEQARCPREAGSRASRGPLRSALQRAALRSTSRSARRRRALLRSRTWERSALHHALLLCRRNALLDAGIRVPSCAADQASPPPAAPCSLLVAKLGGATRLAHGASLVSECSGQARRSAQAGGNPWARCSPIRAMRSWLNAPRRRASLATPRGPPIATVPERVVSCPSLGSPSTFGKQSAPRTSSSPMSSSAITVRTASI
jgi:hypothetical protein